MMKIHFTNSFTRKLKKLKQRNTSLEKQIEKALVLFQNNPNHPSLRLHKIKGSQAMSLSVNMSIRILYFEKEQLYVIFDIGTHDEVY